MDPNRLHALFKDTLHPNNQTRRQAEASLKQLQSQQGFLVACLQISNVKQVNKVLRKIACVYLKNTISAHVSVGDGRGCRWHTVSDADKNTIRQNIVECFMVQDDKAMRNILGECILGIAQDDFPKVWTSLVPEIQKNMRSGNMLRMYNALVATRKLVKKYQFRRKDQRLPLEVLVRHLFPMVRQLYANIINSNEIIAANMMKVCTKIYWSAMQLSLDGTRADPKDAHLWMQLFHAALKKPLPEASTGLEPKGQPTDVEARNEWPWWKLKKWILQVLHRFFSRYGNKGYVEDTHKRLAVWWENTWAKQFLSVVLAFLDAKAKGTCFVSDRVLQLCYCFLNDAIELSSTYKVIKPNLKYILFQSVIPTISFSKADLLLWKEDPHEYIRKSVDMEDDYLSPRTSAMNLLVDLATMRKEPLELLMPYLAQSLNQYVSAGASRTVDMTRHKDGCLVALGAMSEALMDNDKYSGALEGLITRHVLPEFQNPNFPFIRERCCWIIMRYSDLEFQSEHNLQCCVQRIIKSLRDPELPVQMMAATSLRFLLDSDTAEIVIRPVLKDVLSEFFRLMNEIGLDELIHSLEKILDRFGDEIIPIAPMLAQKLAEMFHRFVKADDDDDDESQMAALTTLECISTILEHTVERADVYAQMERTIVPLLHFLLNASGECIEFLETTLRILCWFTYKVPRFSPATWQLFPLMYNAFDKFAFDYIGSMLPCIDNFISRNVDEFLAAKINGTPYIELMWRMVQRTVQKNESQIERATATKILESIILNCRGRVDAMMEPMLKLLVATLQNMNIQKVQGHVVRVVASALYYNATLTVRILESMGALSKILELWMKLMGDVTCFRSVLDKKICALGLISVLALPAQQMPASVRGGYAQILSAAATLLERIHAQRKEIAARASRDSDEDDEDDEDDGVTVERRAFGEDEDAVSAEDSAYLKMIRKMRDEEKAYVDDEDDDDEEDEDEDSPVHNVNAFVLFVESLNAQNAALVNSARSSMPAPRQSVLAQLMQHGVQQKKALLEAAMRKRRGQ